MPIERPDTSAQTRKMGEVSMDCYEFNNTTSSCSSPRTIAAILNRLAIYNKSGSSICPCRYCTGERNKLATLSHAEKLLLDEEGSHCTIDMIA